MNKYTANVIRNSVTYDTINNVFPVFITLTRNAKNTISAIIAITNAIAPLYLS